MNPGENVEKAFSRSLLINNYFSKNRDFYTYKEGSDENFKGIFEYLVFDELEEDFYEKRMRLPYLDCFLTRYVYHTFTRWLFRLQSAVGIKKE